MSGAATPDDDAAAVTPASHPAAAIVLLHRGGEPPDWGARAGAVPLPLPVVRPGAYTRMPDTALAAALAHAECVLVDADTLDPLVAARGVHRADPEVQVIAVVAGEDRRRTLERAILFAPGVGEIWLASPGEVGGGAVAARAAGVTRQRRRFRRTRERLERERMAESPQRTERALISDAYLADLLHVIPDPVFSVDAAGRILSANPAAASVLDVRGSGLVGVPLAAALGTAGALDAGTLLAGAAERTASAELSFRRADGTTGHGELLVSRVAGSEPPFFAVVLHDLTDRYRAQRQLEEQAIELEHQANAVQEQAVELEQANDELLRQRGELEAALATRSRFYAAMSHELRTPINAVMGYTGLALEGIYGPLEDPLRDALTRSQRAAKHLHELVDDVLDLAKIEAGRVELVRELTDVVTLAQDILLSVQPAADAGGTPVSFECRCGLPVSLVTDPRRVRQILLNLLGNALKFAPGRPVTLRCASVAGGVTFSVIDHGPGIPESEQQRVFEEFVQLDTGTGRGTGLGLPISRRLAELLGGTLTLESAPGRGSTFTLVLPRG